MTADTRSRWTTPVVVGTIAIAAALAWWSGWIGGGGLEPVPAFDRRLLTQVAALDVAASISPDGTQIVFERLSANGTGEIFLQSIGGSSPRAVPLTNGKRGSVGGPAISHDGQQIAFHSTEGAGGIFIMPLTGGSIRQLTERGYNLSSSPDDTAIVFELDRTDTDRPYSRFDSRPLVRVGVDGGREKDFEIIDGVQPAWSPNGHRIAYWGLDASGQRDVWTIRADGTEPVQVTADAFFDYSPTWSPNGLWLYYCSNRGGAMAIWRVRIDEESRRTLSKPQSVTSGGPTDPGVLSFSVDGRRLVYREFQEESVIATAAVPRGRVR